MDYYYTINRQSKVGGHENSNKNSNRELQELVQQIQDLPPNSRERCNLLAQLIASIQESGKLTSIVTFSSRKGNIHLTTRFEDVYNDALGKAFLYIAQNIDDYNPENEVMAWVNQTFEWNFLTAFYKEYPKKRPIVSKKEIIHLLMLLVLDFNLEDNFNFKKTLVITCIDWDIKSIVQKIENRYRNQVQLVSFDAPINSDSTTTWQDFLPAPEPSRNHRWLCEFIEDDPEEILENAKMRNCDVSLQQILLLLLDGYKWKEIAEKLQVLMGSVNSFYTRCLKNQKIRDYFRENGFGLQ